MFPTVPSSSLEERIAKAQTLVEALPYIRRFASKVMVIKYGGSLMQAAGLEAGFLEDLALMKLVGILPVLVHGGGPAMTDLLTQLGKSTEFIDGYRVTDEDTLHVAQMVLSGRINKSLVAQLQQQGIQAVGLSGQDGGMLGAQKRRLEGGVDMGFEGCVTQVNTRLLETVMGQGFLPVISPIGLDEGGQAYNLNADVVAVALAQGLAAEKLLFVTDVPGVLRQVDDPHSLISRLSAREARGYIEQGIIRDGMIPKVDCCLEAIEAGVPSVHIINGQIPHALLLEIFTDQGIGTMFLPSLDP